MDKSLVNEAKEKGMITPKEILQNFNQYKKFEISKRVRNLVTAYAKEDNLNMNRWVRAIATFELLTLYDVWLVGTWDADWEYHLGPDSPPVTDSPRYMANFEQFTTLVEEAIDLVGHRPKSSPR